MVLVHDAARPLVTPELVAACLDALGDADAAIAAAPVTDTIKECADGRVVRTLDRSRLWAVQTPQVFRRAALERALAQDDEAIGAATDDAVAGRGDGRARCTSSPRRARTSRSRPSWTCAWPRCCCATAPREAIVTSDQDPAVVAAAMSAMEKYTGVVPGYRRAHAHGHGFVGYFEATPAVAAMTVAEHLQGDRVAVVVRLSNGAGARTPPTFSPRTGG